MTGWQNVRNQFPLDDAQTPHFLKRFNCECEGEQFTFDEGADGTVAPSTNAKRVSHRSELEDPVPKRRETDADEDLDETLLATSITGLNTANLSTAPNSAAVATTPVPLTVQTTQPFVIDAPRSWRLDEPSLLSPTASPRSPSFASENESQSDDGEIARLDAPLSARAYAPLNASPETYISELSQTPPALSINQHLSSINTSFSKLPASVQRYALFKLLKSCNRNTLSSLFSIVEKSLEFDILSSLPSELRSQVMQQLDVKSVIAASQVCRLWYDHVDRDEKVWKQLLTTEQLNATEIDFVRAEQEGWGYTNWTAVNSRALLAPTNVYDLPVNVYKAVFLRLSLIQQNWMRPDILPKKYEIQSPDREVITCLEFDEDYIIASTEGKRHLNVYDTQTGKLLHEFTAHDGGVWALKRVGKDIIVSGSTDHTIRVWSLSKNRCTHVFRGHHATVRCLDVVQPIRGVTHHQFPVILTGSRDTTLRMWRLPDPEDEDFDSKVVFSDAENPYFLAELRGHEESVRTVCGYGDVAVSGSYDFKVRVWDMRTKRCRHVLEGHENKVYATIIDSERNRCVSASMDNHVKIWDLDTGAELYTLTGHTGLVGLLGLRDNTLVSAAADKTLRVWDPETGKLLHNLVGHDTAILCFDHHGRQIVSGSEQHLKLWDTRTGAFCRDLITNIEHIWQVGFDRRKCVAAVARGGCSYLTVLDFDFDPSAEQDRVTELDDESATL